MQSQHCPGGEANTYPHSLHDDGGQLELDLLACFVLSFKWDRSTATPPKARILGRILSGNLSAITTPCPVYCLLQTATFCLLRPLPLRYWAVPSLATCQHRKQASTSLLCIEFCLSRLNHLSVPPRLSCHNGSKLVTQKLCSMQPMMSRQDFCLKQGIREFMPV